MEAPILCTQEKNKKKKKSLDLITIYLRLQLALIGQTFEADLIERIGGVTVVFFYVRV